VIGKEQVKLLLSAWYVGKRTLGKKAVGEQFIPSSIFIDGADLDDM
jgi:hypothetical protein